MGVKTALKDDEFKQLNKDRDITAILIILFYLILLLIRLVARLMSTL